MSKEWDELKAWLDKQVTVTGIDTGPYNTFQYTAFLATRKQMQEIEDAACCRSLAEAGY